MPTSRRKKTMITKTGVEISEAYCRRCMKTLPTSNFYEAVDLDLDKNGIFSICKECVNQMYDLAFETDHSIEWAVLKTCRRINLKYSPEAINATVAHIKTMNEKGKESSFFGIYISKLRMVNRTSRDIGSVGDLTYQEVTQVVSSGNKLDDDDFEEAKSLKIFWGTDDEKDIQFLENELANFKQTHRADTYAEVVLLKEVCYKLLEIHKSRQSKGSTDSSLKQLMEVMKNLAISPRDANAASAGKGADCFGVWLKEISEMRPEEWYEDKSIYKDVDNIEDYNQRIFVSSMRAFTSGNREFTIDGGEIVEDESEGE